jgi:hypothetical protein
MFAVTAQLFYTPVARVNRTLRFVPQMNIAVFERIKAMFPAFDNIRTKYCLSDISC